MGHTLGEKDGWFKPITLCSSIALKVTKLQILTGLVFSLSTTSDASLFHHEIMLPRADVKAFLSSVSCRITLAKEPLA